MRPSLLPVALAFVCILWFARAPLKAQTAVERVAVNPTFPRQESGSRATDGTTGSGASTNKPPLEITSAARRIHGGIVIPTMIVKAAETQFSFVPPPGWRVQVASGEMQIRLVCSAASSLITVEITESRTDSASADAEVLREELLARYPNGRIMDAFSASALGSEGPAFDLEWQSPNNVRFAVRFVQIPLENGRLEFLLSAPASLMKQSSHDLHRLLLSFRSAPLGGSLELQPVTPD